MKTTVFRLILPIFLLFISTGNCNNSTPPPPRVLKAQDGKIGEADGRKVGHANGVFNLGCGLYNSSNADDIKIVGGQASEPGEYPWQVSLQRKSWWGSYSHFCGGSLINSQWVLTAAHCVNGRSISGIEVVVGEHDLKRGEGTEKRVKINKIIVHDKYNSQTIQNDLALLKLEHGLDFEGSDNRINSVCLPSPLQTFSSYCIATGWGTTAEGGMLASVLQEVALPVMSDDKCRESYGKDVIFDSMLCAGLPEGGKDACQGDSGGPFVCPGTDGRMRLAGVVSWGYGCARPKYPGVYTEVAYYINWIEEKMAKN